MTPSDTIPGKVSVLRVIIKGIILFILFNIMFSLIAPLPMLGRISAYNSIFPGRSRLPYGEKPDEAYNFSLYNMEAMFASHEVSASNKPPDEYRVLLIGDSSVWGYLLKPENTLSSFINESKYLLSNGKVIRAYNLGYPTMSLIKDLMILGYGTRYQPDSVIWIVTLDSFTKEKQLDSPIVQNNPDMVKELISKYQINQNISDERFVNRNLLSSSLVGQRRAIADILRLQLYGIMWAATGIDQYYPASYEPPQNNFEVDDGFQDLIPPKLNQGDISFDILSAGSKLAAKTPLIIVNEPIFISNGENSDIRYNFFYPRWAYDQYRIQLRQLCQDNGWQYMDAWDLVSANEFTNSAIHMTPAGTKLFAAQLLEAIKSQAVR